MNFKASKLECLLARNGHPYAKADQDTASQLMCFSVIVLRTPAACHPMLARLLEPDEVSFKWLLSAFERAQFWEKAMNMVTEPQKQMWIL